MIRFNDIVVMKPQYSENYDITREDKNFIGYIQDIIWYNKKRHSGDVMVGVLNHKNDTHIGDRFVVDVKHLIIKKRPIELIIQSVKALEKIKEDNGHEQDYREILELLNKYIEIDKHINL